MIRVGVDVGGTFTDVVLENTKQDSGSKQRVFVTKVPSTPNDQSEGVVHGVLQVCKMASLEPADIDMLFHGTTVATNMVIERNGAEVGMLTTKGFVIYCIWRDTNGHTIFLYNLTFHGNLNH